MSTSHNSHHHHPARRASIANGVGKATSLQSDARRILVVEDEKRLREMLLASLHEIGMTPTGAPTAEAALRLLDQASFAVCLIDLNLPGMSGMEFCETVHRRWPGTQLVILTGFGDIESAKRAIRLDVIDFLTKPCGMDELEVALSRARQRWIDHSMADLRAQGSTAPSVLATSEDDASPPVPSIEAMERQLILAALERHPGNREAVATEVGISVRKLYYRLQQYQREGYVPPK